MLQKISCSILQPRTSIYLLLLLFFTSCGLIQPKWIRYENGGKQAVSKSYHLSRKPFVYSSLIDTISVYVAKNEYVTTNRKGEVLEGLREKYDFIRFGGNGQLFIRSRMLEFPSDEDFNLMQRGQYCFYQIIDNTLKVEIFNHDTRMFEYRYGKIQENGDIIFYKSKGRPWGTYKQKLNNYYTKTPANLTIPIIFPE